MDEFNKAAGVVLSTLYEAFPHLSTLTISKLCSDSAIGTSDSALYNGTILFLAREGFISFESYVSSSAFYSVLLTSKGLAALNATPDFGKDAQEHNATVGESLAAATKSGSLDVLKALVSQVVQGTVAGTLKGYMGY